jgi:hypothetical protein
MNQVGILKRPSDINVLNKEPGIKNYSKIYFSIHHNVSSYL